MPVEKGSLDPDRELRLEELLSEVKGIHAIENVLKNNMAVSTAGEAERQATEALRTAYEKGDQFGMLEAQSELTAAKMIAMQARMKVTEERASTPSYDEAELKVQEILGEDANSPKVLLKIVPEFTKRDRGMRW